MCHEFWIWKHTSGNNVTINYFQTAVVKQYKIDDGGWQNYTGPVKLIASHKLTARSIDKYNVVSQEKECISEVSDDIIGPNAYDGDETTYYQYGKDTNNYMFTLYKDVTEVINNTSGSSFIKISICSIILSRALHMWTTSL